MIWLLFLGTLAQGADAVSLRLDREANWVVLGLGQSAYLAKIALILLIPALVLALLKLQARWPRLQRSASLLLCSLSLIAGLVGAISNLLSE